MVVWIGIDYLEYRASEIGAAVALSVSGELHTLHFDNFSFSSFCPHLEKVRKAHFILIKFDVQCHNRYMKNMEPYIYMHTFIARCMFMSPYQN